MRRLLSAKKQTDNDCIQVDLDRAWERALPYIADAESIGYIGGFYQGDGYMIGLRRKENAITLIKKLGKYRPEHIQTGAFSKAAGYHIMQEMIAQKNTPEAIIIGSDILAAGVVDALREAGINSGEDVRLLIYQDVQSVRLPEGQYAVLKVYPIVTTVEKRNTGHHQRKRQREGFFSKSDSAKPRNVR